MKYRKYKNYKIDYFFIILINFLVRANCDIKLTVKGDGNCIFDSSFGINGCNEKEEISDEKIKCSLSSTGNAITFSSNINSAKNMFKNCIGLTYIDLSEFSTAIIDISGMFENCVNLQKVSFGSFQTSSITNMSRLFYNCSSLTSIEFGANFITTSLLDISYIFFNCSKISLSSIDLSNFKNEKVTNMGHMFELCTNLISLQFPSSFSTSNVENMEYMFSNCIYLKDINLQYFTTTKVKNMNSMFKNCKALESINLNNFVTNQLINMGSMFQSCSSLESIYLTNFNTISVKFMNDLFHDCTKLKLIDISSFNTENVIKMESMFENCKALEKVEIPNFYTPSLRQMHSIFAGCTNLNTIDISNFDTFQITNFANIFYNCHSLEEIKIDNFITDMASDMSNMFFNCSKVQSLDLSNFKTERVLKMYSMFQGCSALKELTITEFKNTQVMDMNHMFDGCSNLDTLNLAHFFTNDVKNMNSLFARCSKLKKLDLSNFDTSNVLNMNSLFYGCSQLESIKLGNNFDTSNVVDMSYMFYYCISLTSIYLNNFKTQNVETFDSMFYNCKSLKSLSIDKFRTNKATSIKSMFHGCSFLESIDLSKFTTDNIIHIDDLFYGCSSLISLDISNFNLRNIDSMSYMFYECKSLTSLSLPRLNYLKSMRSTAYMFAGCSSLTSIDLTFFDTFPVRNMDYMFSGCSYLKYLNIYSWNTRNVESMNYMFSGCTSLKSLNITSFNTENVRSLKGLFYGCASLEFIDLSKMNTSKVNSMEYMFYKAISLTSVKLKESNSPELYFNTELVENMRYMFAYCTNLKEANFSFLVAKHLKDLSYMFYECENLASVNLTNFDTSEVTTMEKMFYRNLNLSYLNLQIATDSKVRSYDDILEGGLRNMVFCFNDDEFHTVGDALFMNRKECSINNCSYNAYDYRKLLIYDNVSIESSDKCIDIVDSDEKCGKKYYYYSYGCYAKCLNDTVEDYYGKKICYGKDEQALPCNIQKVLTGEQNCISIDNLTKTYNNTPDDKIQFIEDTKKEFFYDRDTFASEYVKKNGMIHKYFFDDSISYELTTLSDKNLYNDLTYINIMDCENLLKTTKGIEPNEELMLFKIEYFTEEFKIPIIEYKIFFQNGTELNFSICNCMKFIYSIPVSLNESLLYKYNPNSEYNNELCFQFTTEYKTDIILYDRRNEFNVENASYCESNCKFLKYDNGRVYCECPIKSEFNKFIDKNESQRYDLIYRFHDIHPQSTNLGVLRCFKMLFSKLSINGNYPSIIYIIFIVGNLAAALFFCISDYKNLYSQIQSYTEQLSKTKDKKNKKGRQNIITTGNNPPPKMTGEKIYKKQKNDLISNDTEKNSGNASKFNSKMFGPSSLMKGETDRRLNLSSKDELFWDKTDMEINMLTYAEAIKTDKRGCFQLYFSFLKTRQLLIYIFTNDYNSFIVKVCFILFVFGVCLGINTFFFTDKVIHSYYEKKGKQKLINSVLSHLSSIIISTIISSIIKSIMLILTLTDIDVIDIKETSTMSREEKANRALIKVTSKSTLFFIINFVVMALCWIYVGSFSIVFTNTQMYLLTNALTTFACVIFMPIFYCFIPAALRKCALSGKNNEFLYKFSQFLELI